MVTFHITWYASVLALLSVLPVVTPATGTTVEDTDQTITYQGAWISSGASTSYSGFNEHQTNTSGALALYSFKGYTSVELYGTQANDGAKFSFSVSGRITNCTCLANTQAFQQPLCSLSGLTRSKSYTLTIKHVDTAGRWLHFDYLSLDGNTKSSSKSKPSTKTARKKKKKAAGGLIGGVISGVVALVLLAITGMTFLRRKIRRKQKDSADFDDKATPASDPLLPSDALGADHPTITASSTATLLEHPSGSGSSDRIAQVDDRLLASSPSSKLLAPPT